MELHSKLRVGIVGAGRVGIEWHLPDIRTAGGEVIALADVVPGRAARIAAREAIPFAFDDYRALIALPEVDIVSICTPPVNHAEIAIAAMEAGKHVYLEKPPAMNAEEMIAITAAARRTGKLLMSGSNSIYHSPMQALKKAIDQGDLGEIYYVECLKMSRRRLPNGWLRQKKMGGGIGMDSCAHRIDHVLYLLGSPGVTSVTARTYQKFAHHPSQMAYQLMDVEEGIWQESTGSDVEDMLVAFIQFDTGCTFILRDGYAANVPDHQHCALYGTRAGATLHPLVIHGEGPDGTQTDTPVTTAQDPKGVHVLAFQHYFECIRSGTETQSPGERSIQVMRILDAIYQSSQSDGREIRL